MDIFHDQEIIINKMLSNYSGCDCLFKKFQQLYIDSRNRFICGSSHNIEHDNLRIPMLFSKYALKAKWMYFNRFNNNEGLKTIHGCESFFAFSTNLI